MTLFFWKTWPTRILVSHTFLSFLIILIIVIIKIKVVCIFIGINWCILFLIKLNRLWKVNRCKISYLLPNFNGLKAFLKLFEYHFTDFLFRLISILNPSHVFRFDIVWSWLKIKFHFILFFIWNFFYSLSLKTISLKCFISRNFKCWGIYFSYRISSIFWCFLCIFAEICW